MRIKEYLNRSPLCKWSIALQFTGYLSLYSLFILIDYYLIILDDQIKATTAKSTLA